jgi:large subunit ribosomal protein L3e
LVLVTDDANTSTDSDVTKKLIAPVGGFPHYGIIKNDFLMPKGSIPGTKKWAIATRKSLMVHTSRRDLEKVQLKFIEIRCKFPLLIFLFDISRDIICSTAPSILSRRRRRF